MDFFYRPNPWYAGQFIRKIIPKIPISPLVAPFFTVVLNRLNSLLMTVLVRNVDETFLNSEITLPINKNGDLDINFMASFIMELERGNIEELEAYLLATGLNNYELTEDEKSILIILKKLSGENLKSSRYLKELRLKNYLSKQRSYQNKKLEIICFLVSHQVLIIKA